MKNFEESYRGKKVLVTGANGFIGEHIVRRLIEAKAYVFGTYRSRPLEDIHIHWARVDLANYEEIDKLVKKIKPEYVFHLASHVLGSREFEAINSTFNSNLTSTVNLLSVCGSQNIKRIVLSSSLEEPQRGDPNAVPTSPYAAAKFAASAYGRMFHALYNMPVAIARMFMVYGPAQKDLKKLIPYVILELLQDRVPKLSSGIRRVDWIYVEDLVQGLLAIGCNPIADGNTIDLGSGTYHTVREVVEQLCLLVNPSISPKFGTMEDRVMEQVRIANINETEGLIGWRPETNLEQGLRQTIDWFRDNSSINSRSF